VHVILQEPYYDAQAEQSGGRKTGATVVMVANSVGGDDGSRRLPAAHRSHREERVADALDQKSL
jgi:hypothetical protein